MSVSVRWFDLAAVITFHEKIISGHCNSPMASSAVSKLISKLNVIGFNSIRWSYGLNTDWSMLYYAISSLYPFISRNDTFRCVRIHEHFSIYVDVDVKLRDSVINNRQFHILFYLATFLYDVDSDTDSFYNFWTHGRTFSYNMQHTMHFRKRNVAFDRTHQPYFFSKFDANLWYHISFEIVSRSSNSVFAYLFCSLYFMSFFNTNAAQKALRDDKT